MPDVIARAGKLAGVDLLPHVDRFTDPVFAALALEICAAGARLHNEIHAEKKP